MFQNYALFPHKTVRQQLDYACHKPERVQHFLDRIELERLDRVYPARLSGGQQQRLALARSLIRPTQWMVLDEPVGALEKVLRPLQT